MTLRKTVIVTETAQQGYPLDQTCYTRQELLIYSFFGKVVFWQVSKHPNPKDIQHDMLK